MKRIHQLILIFGICQLSIAEEVEPIVLWGIYQADIENVEIDSDSTWSHNSTYSFKVTDGPDEIEKVFVSSWVMNGAKDPRKKMKGIKFGTRVKLSITRKYKDEVIPLNPESGILYIYSDEFKILKKGRANKAADTTEAPANTSTRRIKYRVKRHRQNMSSSVICSLVRAKRPELWTQQVQINPTTSSTGL